MFANYRRLCKQPHWLDWTGNPARSRLMRVVRSSDFLPYPRCTIYDKLIRHLTTLPNISAVVESSYDWRDSVLRSCQTVIRQIEASLSVDLATKPDPDEDRLIVVSHSLGA
jgi:hypothetical protein